MKTHLPISINIKDNIDVLEVVKRHLEESILFKNEEYIPQGGLFIDPKPKKIRVDVIMLNLLYASYYMDEAIVKGLVNINVQHEDTDRIECLVSIIKDIMESAYVEGYLFSGMDSPNMLGLSRTLRMKNIRTGFERKDNKIGETLNLRQNEINKRQKQEVRHFPKK